MERVNTMRQHEIGFVLLREKNEVGQFCPTSRIIRMVTASMFFPLRHRSLRVF